MEHQPGVAAEVSAVVGALEPLRFVVLRAVMEAQDRLELPPYQGSTLRGAFGLALRQTVCVDQRGDCRQCLVSSACAYRYVFETPVLPDARRMRKYTYAPHPFVIEPPKNRRVEYEPGDLLEFGLVLVGKAAELVPYVAAAVERMGQRRGLGRQRGKARLLELSQTFKGAETPGDGMKAGSETLWARGDALLRGLGRPQTVQDLLSREEACGRLPVSCVSLEFETPCRVTDECRLSDRPEFHVIFRALLRRLSSLAVFHCGSELDIHFRDLVARARGVRMTRDETSWTDWQRYSARQQSHMKMGGIVGRAEYSAVPAVFLPFLRLGEVLHVGKGTAMGLGRYTMTVSYGGRAEERI